MADPPTINTYERIADEYRDRHGDRSGVRELVDRFLSLLEERTDGRSGRVIDVGCGPGWESATLIENGYTVVSIDVVSQFLRATSGTAPAASVLQMDMRQLGIAGGAFDGLWACASFLHVPRGDAGSTLSEFHRVLRPGGVLHISVKRGEGETTGDSYPEDSRTFTLYGPEELNSLATESGFTVASVGVDDGWVQLFARA